MVGSLSGKSALSLGLLALLLVVCNFAFAKSNGWSRWGWQVFSFIGLLSVFKLGGLTLADIGLDKSKVGSGFKYAAIAIVIILLAFLVAFLVQKSLFKDSRYEQSLRNAITASLFVVPLKTVLFEELAFRGIMPALLKDLGSSSWIILLVSSISFGLWHILTAPVTTSITSGKHSHLLIVGAVFVATCVAGAVFYYLRQQSGSLIAPIAVHWFINGTAIILAALSWAGR